MVGRLGGSLLLFGLRTVRAGAKHQVWEKRSWTVSTPVNSKEDGDGRKGVRQETYLFKHFQLVLILLVDRNAVD